MLTVFRLRRNGSMRVGRGRRRPFPIGETISLDQVNFDPYDDALKSTVLKRTCAVGSYRPNGFGLYDMHGNVFEWCADLFDEDYYDNSDEVNPRGPVEGVNRVFRGVGFVNNTSMCRSAYRGCASPKYKTFYLGFRVALDTSGE